LGGSNFSQTPAATYPQAYIMIGVPGTSAGTAYESFSITPTNTHPNGNVPTLNGTLMIDQNNNYNFVPSGNAEFVAHSDASTSSYIKVGNKTFTPPGGTDNFWLLALDRETRAPINNLSTNGATANCDSTPATQSCGATWTVNTDGGNGLAALLSSLPPMT
jgi:hypothetical protein